jgi:hypothetical protein
LGQGAEETYQVRPAQEPNLEFIACLYEASKHRSVIQCERDRDTWLYELKGKDPLNVNRWDLRVITTQAGEPVGFLAHPFFRWGDMAPVTRYEIKPGLSWAAVTPSVIRQMFALGKQMPTWPQEDHVRAWGFWLGAEHPVYDVLLDRMPRVRQPYAWFIRIPDIPAFLRQIRPALEARLAKSYFVGHTGELRLTFYTGGVKLGFDQGELIEIEPYQPHPVGQAGDAGFPGLTFLQLLMGYRSLAELKTAFADCWTETPEIHALLNALFPKKASDVWAVS